MKILFVANCIDVMGGAERVINVLANKFSEDNEVTVLSELKGKERFFNYNDNIKIEYLLDRYINSGPSSLVLRKLYDLYHRIARPIRIRGTMKGRKYDVIVFDRVYVALHFLPHINTIGTKIIVRDAIHLYTFNNLTKRRLKRYFPKKVDVFVVSSNESANAYREFFGNITRINMVKVYNPLGIEPHIGYNFSNNEIVTMGRIDDPQKGIDVLIKAFRIVHSKYPNWKLHIYGGNEEILKKMGAEDLSEEIIVSPPTKEVVRALNAASIYVSPARYEGYANSLVEAMACGVPSVTYDWLMGANEIVENGEDGIIVPLSDRVAYKNGIYIGHDIEGLAGAICDLIEHPNTCKEFSIKAAKSMRNRSKDSIIAQWKQFLQ